MSSLSTQVGGGHYKDLAIQPVEYISKNRMGFIEGSVVKYVTRWRAKGGISDLKKAIHFLQILIEFESDGETPEQVRDVRDIGVEEKQEDPGGVRAGEVAIRNARFYPPIYPRRQDNPPFWSRDLCRVEGEARRRDKEEDDSCS